MTKLPRDLSGAELIRRLARLGYRAIRQTGSHVALSSDRVDAQPCFVPLHKAIRPGTLADILKRIAQDQDLSMPELLRELGF